MVKYEDILKQIEGADYIPLEQRTKVQNVIPKAQVQETNKSVLDTAKLIGSNIVSGANSVFEGIADLGASALIPAAKLTSKLVDNKVGKFIFGEDAADYHNNPLYQIAQPMIEENISQDITQSAANKYDKTSYVKSDSTVAKVSQGLGQAVGLVIGGKFFDFNAKLPTDTKSKVFNTLAKQINQPTSQAMFLSTAGNSYGDAKKEGATDAEALVYGVLNGSKEVGTELMYGGLGSVFGTGALDDVVEDLLTKQIKNELLKNRVKLGLGMAFEGLEEDAATLLDPFVKSVYKHKLDFSDYKNLLDDFVVGFLTSGVMQGGEIAINKAGQIRNNVAGSNNEILPINSSEQGNEGNDKKGSSTNTQTTENNQNNIINLPTAQSTQTTSIENLVESSSSRKALESLQEQNNANLQALLEQQRTLNESKLQEIENEEQRIKNQQLLEETNKRIAELEAEMKELVPTANTEGMNLQESAERYGLNANSTPVKTIQLMLENRGINARFDSTPFKNSSTNAIWSKDGNGNRSVIFNPKASPDTVLENIAIHELTHDLMSSVDSRKALRTDDLLSYVKSLEGYQEARNDLIHTYSAMYNPNSDSFQSLIDEEVVADVLGRRLGNQEFVTRLVNQKPSIARSIYNWVVDKLNSIVNRGGNVRNEKLYWENVKNRFENAYNMSYNSNTEAGTRYATVKNNPYGHIKEFVKMKQEQQEEAHRVISPLAAKYAGIEEAYSATDINGNTYDFEIFEDGNYRVTKIERLNENTEEVLDETDINSNSRYSMASSKFIEGNSGINNQSNRDNGTSRENVKIPTREQIKSQDRLSNQTQNGNNKGLNSSFSNAKINDYEQMQNEIKSQIDKAYKIDEDFGKNMEKQYKEYREKNQLQYEILKNTKSRQAQNVNDDFFKEHESDYDGKSGTKTPDGKVTSIKLQKGDNLAKLSYTENADKIWIDELYVKNQNQGFGSEIVNAIKEYAERNGKDVEAFKELSTAKGFWDKTLRKNNAETRYSLAPTEDNQGRKLSKEQQEYFKDSKVRDENGNLMVMYHGTESNVGLPENEKFTIFDRDRAGSHGSYYGSGFYFTPSSETAQDYAKSRGDVYETYLNMTNPYIPSADTINKDGSVTFAPTFYEDFENRFREQLPQYWNDENTNKGRVVRNVLQDNGYDGIINGDTYVVFESNQIKNVDNTNPTSNEDIRYSKEAKEWNEFLDKNVSSTGTTGTLMAIHNLGEKKLKGILELGGIPVPSIAVTNPNLVDHSSFGNISLIFNKNTIDPSNKENEVYDRDVWSPTQPQIDYYIDSETLEKVANKLGIRDYDLEDYADNNKTPEYLSDRLTRVDEIVDKYVTDNNIQYETAYKTPEMRVEFHELSEDIKQFIKNNDLTVFKLAQDENLKNEYYRLIKDYYDNANFPQQSKEYLYKEKVDFLDKWLEQQSSIDSTIMRGLQRYQDDFDLIKKGENKVVDEWQTEKNKRQAAIDNGLQEYLIQETAPLFKEKGIYNGKEYLTSSGRRRSFWELHDEYNLENIVDAMTKGSTKGTQNWVSGFGQIQAQMANRFNSLSEIKNAESQIMPDANNTRLVELREKLESDIDNLSNKYDGWGGMEIASELIADFASQTNHDIETFRKLLNENYQAFGRINDNEINQIIEHLEELRDLPTDYFEAKPQRAVDLDEIEVVVIPNNTAEEIREQLKTAGLDFVEYNPDVEGDRQRVINKFDNLKFSKNSNGKWQDFVNKHFESKGTTTRLGDIKLPTKQQPKIPTKQVAKKPTTNQTKLLPVKESFTEKTNISTKEYEEYQQLKEIENMGLLLDEEEKRLSELENKYKNIKVNYPGLKTDNKFSDIKQDYAKYIKDNSEIDLKVMNNALDIIQANNQGRRTKEQWLDVAKNIGQNYKGDTEGLKKYAFKTFFELSPNKKESLNRQGKKYVNFDISDWINSVYKGAGAGEIKIPTYRDFETKSPQPTQKATIPMAKKDDVIKVASQKIAKQINSTGGFDLKQRSWVGTSTESEILKDKVYIDDLDVKKINYVVQSNKKSLDSANNHIKTYGYEKTLEDVKSIMRSDKLPSASDVALMQRMIQEASKKGDAETVQDLIMNTAIIGTDLGQATQALSIIQRLTPEGQLKMYTKLVQRAKSRGEKSFQNVEITPEMVQNVLEAYKKDGTYDQEDLNKRVEKFKQSIADQMKTTTGEKIDAWRYLSMLGNPKTHIRNMVSNVAMRGTIKVKNAMARTMETILPVKDRTKTWKKASNAVQNFAEETANEMKGVITGENKYNEKSSIESKKQIFKNKTLEKISNFNSNALEAEDWFFSKKAFKDTLQEYLTANNINTQEDIKNNAELVEKAKLYAVEQAEIATFRQYSKLASMIGQFQRKSKFGRIAVEALMPFKKTPVNVAKAGVSYSPIGLLKNISYDVYQLKQGNINASQFIDNLAQGLTGTSLTLLGYALAKSGVLTGSGGDDKDDKYDKQLGKTGYSLNIGGNSYSISWLSPVAMPLLVGSNAYEQLEEDKEWDMNVVSDTLAKTLDPLNEMSFMQGLTNALQSYGSGADKIKGSLESTAQNYVGQFFPTLFSQLAATTDDKKRSTKASNNSSYKFGEQTIRSIMYKVPGLRQQLEVATDIWGNEKEQSDNILVRALESFIAPYSKNKDISTNLDKEIKRVYNETGESGVIPNIPYAYTKYDGETYKMSAKEYTDFKKTYGQTANSTLNKLINSADYKQATDEDKAKMIDSVYDYARAKANEEYFDNIDTNYENQMIDKLDTLKSNYGISADTYFANKKEYDYAYQNPDKYSVIRQIAKYDKYTTYKNEITDIRNNTSNDKIETIKYINSLNMNIPQKAMFIKQYYKSFKQYDSQIIQYINNQKLTSKEKEQILTQLGFTIKDGRVYY